MKITVDDKILNKLSPKERCIYLYYMLYPDKTLREIAYDLHITFYKARVTLLSVKKNKNQSEINQKINQKSIRVQPLQMDSSSTSSIKNQSENQTKIKQDFVKYKDNFPCSKWQNKLYNDLIPFIEKYGKNMIADFCDYWNEPNKSKSDCRWHMEKTWSINGRLSLWSRREKKNRNKSSMILNDNSESKYDKDDEIWGQ